jgi:diphthamide synthase (EF-2-diphthine--ammonia ligase)
VDPCGERGEFHTFVWDGPMFATPISIERGVTVDRDGFVFADVLPSDRVTSTAPTHATP